MAYGLVYELIGSAIILPVVTIGIFLIRKGRELNQPVEQIAETETPPIEDLEPGRAEVEGTARPIRDAGAMEQKFSEGEALATHLEVKNRGTDNEGRPVWKTIHEETRTVPFVVDGGTGEVRVDPPSDCWLDVESTRITVGEGEEPPEQIRRFIEQEDSVDDASILDLGPVSMEHRRRYIEEVIEPGDEVYILGKVREAQAGWDRLTYVIDEPPEGGEFILSIKSEEELVEENKGRGDLLRTIGWIWLLIGSVLLIALLGVAVGLVVLVGIFLVVYRDKLEGLINYIR